MGARLQAGRAISASRYSYPPTVGKGQSTGENRPFRKRPGQEVRSKLIKPEARESMSHPRTASHVLPVPVLRRLTLAWLGFRSAHQGEWRRGAVVITEETLDALSPQAFAQRVRHWQRQRTRLV
jgi:hypothetical protein